MAGYYNNGGYQQNGFNGGQQGFNGAPQGGYNNAPQQGGQQRSYDFNKVHNWNVRVFGVKPTRKGFYLNCGLSGKKKPDGSYAKQMFVSVFVGQNCDCPRDINWDKLDISVDGTFSVDEWVQQNGNVIPQYNIYAEKITIRQRENRQGGYQQGYNNAPQQGYNSAPQGGYNNAPQQGFNGTPQGGYNNPPQGGYQQNGFIGGQQGFNGAPQGGFNGAPQQGVPDFGNDFEAFANCDGVPF